MLCSYNLRPDGEPDPFSMHGGCPPADGSTAWKVNKWIWNRPCTFITHFCLLSRALTQMHRCGSQRSNGQVGQRARRGARPVPRPRHHGPRVKAAVWANCCGAKHALPDAAAPASVTDHGFK